MLRLITVIGLSGAQKRFCTVAMLHGRDNENVLH